MAANKRILVWCELELIVAESTLAQTLVCHLMKREIFRTFSDIPRLATAKNLLIQV